jgi:hypothetical protein
MASCILYRSRFLHTLVICALHLFTSSANFAKIKTHTNKLVWHSLLFVCCVIYSYLFNYINLFTPNHHCAGTDSKAQEYMLWMPLFIPLIWRHPKLQKKTSRSRKARLHLIKLENVKIKTKELSKFRRNQKRLYTRSYDFFSIGFVHQNLANTSDHSTFLTYSSLTTKLQQPNRNYNSPNTPTPPNQTIAT